MKTLGFEGLRGKMTQILVFLVPISLLHLILDDQTPHYRCDHNAEFFTDSAFTPDFEIQDSP
jgi:hypothetical protein